MGSQIVGKEGIVICFEPVPDFAESLRENISLNNRSNIVVEQVAVSDVTGEALLSLVGTNSSIVSLENRESIRVKTVALDEYLASRGIKKVDFLIIDVEGAEPLVLKGARRTLETSVDFLLMEVNDDALRRGGCSSEELIRNAVSMGFHPYAITRNGLQPLQPGGKSETLNVFFSKMILAWDQPQCPRPLHIGGPRQNWRSKHSKHCAQSCLCFD